MTNRLPIPKGRPTIRAGGTLTGMNGKKSRPIRLWPFSTKPNTPIAQLENAYISALDVVDKIETRTRNSSASGRFTSEGVKADALKYAVSELVPVLHRARNTIKRAKADVAEQKSKLKIEGPDKSDLAGAFRRDKIREGFKEMKGDEQRNYFVRNDGKLPNDVAMAILEMPTEFSGVAKSRYDLIMNAALETQFGPRMAEIDAMEEAIAIAESAVETARDEVRIEAGGVDEHKFNELANAVEQKHDAPWLRRGKDDTGAEAIVVVDLVQGVERPATPEEIETGMFYADFEHYRKGKAA